MTPSPLVSVIIPNWNGARFLAPCLAALAAQTLRPLEIVVVDNGSSDGSMDLLHAWKPPEGITKTLVPLPDNLGFAAGVNRGILASRGCFIALLNNDTEADPKWLAEAVIRLESRPDIGFIASKLVLADSPDTLDTAGHGLSSAGAGYARHRWARDGEDTNREVEVFGACAAAAIYRREALEATGLLDEDFFCYYEDLDLDARLQLAGYRCLYVPASVVRHKVSASAGGGRSDFVVRLSSRNQEWFYIQNMPGRLVWTRLPAHLLYNMGRFAVYVLKGRGLSFLRGKLEALGGVFTALARRKAVQSTRRIDPGRFAAKLDTHWFRRHFLDHLR